MTFSTSCHSFVCLNIITDAKTLQQHSTPEDAPELAASSAINILPLLVFIPPLPVYVAKSKSLATTGDSPSQAVANPPWYSFVDALSDPESIEPDLAHTDFHSTSEELGVLNPSCDEDEVNDEDAEYGEDAETSSTRQRVRVVIYEDCNEPPRTFWIPLVDTRIAFIQHPFPSITQFPRLSYSVYDIYQEHFVEIGTFMSMDATFGENPFLIVRQSKLRDDECPGLGDRIDELNSLITTDFRELQYGTSSPQITLSGLLLKYTITVAACLIRQCMLMLAWVWNVPKALWYRQAPVQPPGKAPSLNPRGLYWQCSPPAQTVIDVKMDQL
ncbi:hypothetical protein NP233_g9045 [Leucocoprinus birnbaumii]|uniref:Uncharacterized protein n=1 Tax=Leucocoprinus birnbaumii TaxID=56174 RepID=A0AAD5VRT5_9AGAR|nr:hypothetical protein NP233_g9045 [Leucocoprinus birnbaumii]